MSASVGSQEKVYNADDTGLFGTILKAWSNHWNVRTCPEDWWLPVITKVAKVVDDHADTQELRKLFVNGKEGKETITVSVNSFTIYDTDYTYVFNEFSKEIKKRIVVPGYVNAVSCDFSTTSSTQLISSQITIMKSLQKYFDYRMMMCGCGIKALEMRGTEEDWASLKIKLQNLKALLAPVEKTLRLSSFFKIAENVFDNLLKTYKDGQAMKDWWADILIQGKAIKYGGSGMRMGEVDAYNGWILEFLSGTEKFQIKAEEFKRGEYSEHLSCISSCPMNIVDAVRNISDDSILISGILGFKVHDTCQNGVATLEPAHGWVMLLPVNSPLRK